MTEPFDEIKEVKESIDRERNHLLTALAAMAFLCICLFVSNIALGAYAVTTINERDAMSIALDDQRSQYYRCLRDEIFTASCPQDLVSPPSRDILRDLESAGFSDILYTNYHVKGVDYAGIPANKPPKEAFGLLGRIVYR